MTQLSIAVVVEGQGEEEALPVLLRRIAAEMDPPVYLRHPIELVRRLRNKIVKPRELENAVELAARNLGGRGAILVLLDSDDDCPAELGPSLLKRAQGARKDLPVGVALANREFESWFVAAADSLRGQCGLGDDISAPEDPEVLRNPKRWLTERMTGSCSYSPTTDQATMAKTFDLTLCRQRSGSFDKLHREVAGLLEDLRRRGQARRS